MDGLVERLREELAEVRGVREIKMFGSVGFMLNGKLIMTARDYRIMCRANPDALKLLTQKEGCRPMESKGRVYKGWVLVDNSVLGSKRRLSFWVRLALEFNKKQGTHRQI